MMFMSDYNSKAEEQDTEAQGEVLNFDKPDFTFIPQGTHDMRQQGYYLICFSCEVQHAVWIGRDKLMVGVNDKGEPILKTRKELGIT